MAIIKWYVKNHSIKSDFWITLNSVSFWLSLCEFLGTSYWTASSTGPNCKTKQILVSDKLQVNKPFDYQLNSHLNVEIPVLSRVRSTVRRYDDVGLAFSRYPVEIQSKLALLHWYCCWYWAWRCPHRVDALFRCLCHRHSNRRRCLSCPECTWCVFYYAFRAGIYAYRDPVGRATFAARSACSVWHRRWPISWWHKSTSPCVTLGQLLVARACVSG